MKYFLSFFFALTMLSCRQEKGFLILNRETDSIISPPESHQYRLMLGDNQFCALVVEQKGIDLIIKLLDPQGDTLQSFDSPNNDWGPENINFFSEKKGIYTFLVKPYFNNAKKGRYSINLIRKENRGRTPEKQVDQLFTFIDRPDSPGATVAIAHGDQILYSHGYGSANLEYNIPNSPFTIFHIASVSKQFTAFSIAMLVNQGKLSYNDDIRKYLPELHDFGDTIRIKHLLHHTSGLRDQWNLLALAGWRLDDVITHDQVLRLISRQKDLNFRPGEKMLYCNTGYTLLAEIVSRVTGESFSRWTKENIFDPLDMNNTQFYVDHEKIVPNRAYSYSSDKNGFKKSVLSYSIAGATSLFTTVEDIMKWADNFNTLKVGNKAIMNDMNIKGILNNGDTISYAFGQFVDSYKGLTAIHHSGSDAGYRTYFIRFPEQQYAIAVFSNLSYFDPGAVAYKIADIYLKDFIKEEKPNPENKTAGNNTATISLNVLQEYTGKYSLVPGIVLEVRMIEGHLVAQTTGQPVVNMIARNDTTFFIAEGGPTLIFKRNSNGIVNRVLFMQADRNIIAKKLTDFEIKIVKLTDYEGTFYSPELETSYTFKVINDTLYALHQRHDPIVLSFLKDDTFIGNAWFFENIDFIRNIKKEVTVCLVSSGRVQNVKFYRKECLE